MRWPPLYPQTRTRATRLLKSFVGITGCLVTGCMTTPPASEPTPLTISKCVVSVPPRVPLTFEGLGESAPLLDQAKALIIDREALIAGIAERDAVIEACK